MPTSLHPTPTQTIKRTPGFDVSTSCRASLSTALGLSLAIQSPLSCTVTPLSSAYHGVGCRINRVRFSLSLHWLCLLLHHDCDSTKTSSLADFSSLFNSLIQLSPRQNLHNDIAAGRRKLVAIGMLASTIYLEAGHLQWNAMSIRCLVPPWYLVTYGPRSLV